MIMSILLLYAETSAYQYRGLHESTSAWHKMSVMEVNQSECINCGLDPEELNLFVYTQLTV
jgi:hypothetical protein